MYFEKAFRTYVRTYVRTFFFNSCRSDSIRELAFLDLKYEVENARPGKEMETLTVLDGVSGQANSREMLALVRSFSFSFLFSHTFTFQLLNKPRSQVSSLLHPRFLPSIFIAHRVQQSHCSSIFHRVLLTPALALSASQFVHDKKSPRT